MKIRATCVLVKERVYTVFMVAFFIKKSFFDGWDHLAGLTLVNVGFLVCLLPLLLLGIPGLLPIFSFVLLALSLLLAVIWYAFSCLVTRRFADFSDFHLAEAIATLRQALVPGLQLGLSILGIVAIAMVGLPFYLSRGLLGGLAAGIILWAALAFFIAFQYFLPLKSRFGGGFIKNLKKSFILFFDNPGFSLFLFVWSLGTLLLSAFLAFLVPGGAGVALAHNDALRLRLRKYDWLEGQKEQVGRRVKVPWKELNAEDDELVGKRTLKGMIFPWKE